MKSYWLQRGGGKDCLLFLAGWGMGPEPFQDVDFGETDVLLVYDYRNIDDSLFATLPQEKPLHLLAWSMGVWAAAWLAEHGPRFAALRFSTATAIGGTLRPIDDQKGISVQNVEKMLSEFSPTVLENFYRSMFDSEVDAEHFLARRPQRPWQELRDELRCLRDLCRSADVPPDIYGHRIVTSRDRIFPARNQLRAWGRDRCDALPLPHFPFFNPAVAALPHQVA